MILILFPLFLLTQMLPLLILSFVLLVSPKGINDVVVSSTYKGCDPMVDAVHAQDSIMGSVIVGVTGTLTDKENTKRKFAQSFFLAPQETGGFFVRNDILQFLDVDKPIASLSGPPQVPETELKSPTVTSPRNSAYPPPGLLAEYGSWLGEWHLT